MGITSQKDYPYREMERKIQWVILQLWTLFYNEYESQSVPILDYWAGKILTLKIDSDKKSRLDLYPT